MAGRTSKSLNRINRILPAIGMIMIASALFRLSDIPMTAFAQNAAGSSAPDGNSVEATPAVLAELAKREEMLAERERRLLLRQRELELSEARIADQLAALEAAETSLLEKITIAEAGAEDDVAQLTQVYAEMKPKRAAALFSEMEPSFAAGFLARMNPIAAAAILANMTPDAAYTISVVMAGRNVNNIEDGQPSRP